MKGQALTQFHTEAFIMVRLQITENDTGSWTVHAHPHDKLNLDRTYTFDNKLAALQKAKQVLEHWLLEMEDC